ncbi:MAG: hypothetical protein U5L74_05310 [Ideonella sp.]|nr:hypothetical protein [Ideonella sp.]
MNAMIQALSRMGLLLAALCAAPAVQAQVFKDPALEALHLADNYAELGRVGTARAAADASDEQAVLAQALAALRSNVPAQRQAALARAQQCVERVPKSAACHYAWGAVLGVQAMSEGLMKMAGSVGRIKDELRTASALEPAWFPARGAVVEFYLQAPGLVGGSVSTAREVAMAAPKPEQVTALQGRLALHDKQFDQALKVLGTLQLDPNTSLGRDVRQWQLSAAMSLLNEGQAERVRPTLERLMRERADALGLWGMARLHAVNGAHEQALQLLDKLAPLPGADRLPLDYRRGVSQQALGQLEVAKAAFQRFVAKGSSAKNLVEDAKQRLDKLR